MKTLTLTQALSLIVLADFYPSKDDEPWTVFLRGRETQRNAKVGDTLHSAAEELPRLFRGGHSTDTNSPPGGKHTATTLRRIIQCAGKIKVSGASFRVPGKKDLILEISGSWLIVVLCFSQLKFYYFLTRTISMPYL